MTSFTSRNIVPCLSASLAMICLVYLHSTVTSGTCISTERDPTRRITFHALCGSLNFKSLNITKQRSIRYGIPSDTRHIFIETIAKKLSPVMTE